MAAGRRRSEDLGCQEGGTSLVRGRYIANQKKIIGLSEEDTWSIKGRYSVCPRKILGLSEEDTRFVRGRDLACCQRKRFSQSISLPLSSVLQNLISIHSNNLALLAPVIWQYNPNVSLSTDNDRTDKGGQLDLSSKSRQSPWLAAGHPQVEGTLASLAERAKLVADTLNSIEGITCNTVQGAMYAFPQVNSPRPTDTTVDTIADATRSQVVLITAMVSLNFSKVH